MALHAQGTAGELTPTPRAHLTGVVLRLNDDGSTPGDNPFHDCGASPGGDEGASVWKIFAYGVRNSFGLAEDPFTGGSWNSENGDDTLDEINRIEPGHNGGWVQVMGPLARVTEFKSIETTAPFVGLQQVRRPPDNIADSPIDARAHGQLSGIALRRAAIQLEIRDRLIASAAERANGKIDQPRAIVRRRQDERRTTTDGRAARVVHLGAVLSGVGSGCGIDPRHGIARVGDQRSVVPPFVGEIATAGEDLQPGIFAGRNDRRDWLHENHRRRLHGERDLKTRELPARIRDHHGVIAGVRRREMGQRERWVCRVDGRDAVLAPLVQ